MYPPTPPSPMEADPSAVHVIVNWSVDNLKGTQFAIEYPSTGSEGMTTEGFDHKTTTEASQGCRLETRLSVVMIVTFLCFMKI